MGIENLGNNQFGKLAAQNYNKSKAQENAVDLTNNQIKNTTTKGVNLNKGTLQVGQKDLTEAFMNKADDLKGFENDGRVPTEQEQAKGKSGKSNKKPHKHTDLEKAMLNEMQNDKTNGDWGAGAAIVYLGSRIYHWIKGD